MRLGPVSGSGWARRANLPGATFVGNVESRFVKTWAVFLYGIAVGLAVAWVGTTVAPTPSQGWLLMTSALALGAALIIHQRAAQLERGRRWRRTY